jgi:hypothetical protein
MADSLAADYRGKLRTRENLSEGLGGKGAIIGIIDYPGILNVEARSGVSSVTPASVLTFD